jgi:hypothetical protein
MCWNDDRLIAYTRCFLKALVIRMHR